MRLSESEVTEQLFQALKVVQDHPDLGGDWLERTLPGLVKGWRPVDYLYKPDTALITRISDYNQWRLTKTGEDAGHLMEEIVLLAFRCLKGISDIKSYQSYAPQLDLVVSGEDSDWRTLIEYLHMDWTHRTIVIEAKNRDDKVDDSQFSRLCGILQNIFGGTSALGVFFSRSGATGFPDVDCLEENMPRKRSLEDAQATQIVFHARTCKYVVVLDDQDIQKLTRAGALPRILEAKIRAVEEWTGLPIEFDGEWKSIDLPPHLAKLVHRDVPKSL